MSSVRVDSVWYLYRLEEREFSSEWDFVFFFTIKFYKIQMEIQNPKSIPIPFPLLFRPALYEKKGEKKVDFFFRIGRALYIEILDIAMLLCCARS